MGIQHKSQQIYKGESSPSFQIVPTTTSTIAMECDFCSLKNNNEPSNGEISECPFCDYHSKVPPDLQPMQETNFPIIRELTVRRREFGGRFECNVCAGDLERQCAFCNYYSVEDDELGISSTVQECKFCMHEQERFKKRIKTYLTGKHPVFSRVRSSTSKEEDSDGRPNTSKRRCQYKCKVCPFSCLRVDVLKRHEQNHWNTTTVYPCPLCPRTSKTRQRLRYHLMTHTGETPYKCSYCSFSASQRGALKIHERTHTGEKPYRCQYCEYRCISNTYLVLHERRHTGYKPYKCSYCMYTCVSPFALHQHQRVHKGEKPYRCQYCEYRAVSKAYLQFHERRHRGKEPYKCRHCECTCVTLLELHQHERTHTRVKPNRCKDCSFRCNSGAILKIHQRKHTGEKPYSCSFCSYRAVSRRNLKGHVMRNHVHPGKSLLSLNKLVSVAETELIGVRLVETQTPIKRSSRTNISHIQGIKCKIHHNL